MSEKKFYYRLEESICTDKQIRISIKKYEVLKETDCTVILKVGCKEKRVYKNSNASFAKSSLENAKSSFKIRKERQWQLSLHTAERARLAVDLCKTEEFDDAIEGSGWEGTTLIEKDVLEISDSEYWKNLVLCDY